MDVFLFFFLTFKIFNSFLYVPVCVLHAINLESVTEDAVK